MKGGKHFSHVGHPLRFFEDKQVEDFEEDVKPYFCRICGLPILSVPSYTCSVDTNCNFFLHKPCAQLPEELLNHPIHKSVMPSSMHTLRLKPKSTLFGKISFTYQCDHSGCNFEIHPLAVLPADIKTKHRSHQSHPLVAFSRQTLCRCDGCGEEHKGFFFCCQECDFWIHQDCTLLPSVVKLPSHPHPFLLTYSLPSFILYDGKCKVCEKSLHLHSSGVYFCGECYSLAHPNCAESSMQNLETGNS